LQSIDPAKLLKDGRAGKSLEKKLTARLSVSEGPNKRLSVLINTKQSESKSQHTNNATLRLGHKDSETLGAWCEHSLVNL